MPGAQVFETKIVARRLSHGSRGLFAVRSIWRDREGLTSRRASRAGMSVTCHSSEPAGIRPRGCARSQR